jgi:hypothetical protein
MKMSNVAIAREVDRLFEEDRKKYYGELSTIPIVCGSYVPGQENRGVIRSLKKKVRAALLAREWFADNGPPDMQPLPLSYGEREALKGGGAPHILAWYARSLESRKYDVLEHPLFDDYARGVMASEHAPYFIKKELLLKRFPPRVLPGLGPGLSWEPPEEHARTMESLRRCREREDRIRAVIAARDGLRALIRSAGKVTRVET